MCLKIAGGEGCPAAAADNGGLSPHLQVQGVYSNATAALLHAGR